MEEKCKIGGESLSNRGVVNKDRISELPEALILHILSSLPTETAITTSVLSKSWKSLWKVLPNLNFDSDYHYRDTFSENLCKSLISHKAPVLDSLHLRVEDESDASDVGIWTGIAFARHVRELVLSFPFEDEGSVRFPNVLCSCNDTLEILKLKFSILLDLPSRVCFKSLRELHLYYVLFKDEESVSNLLCGCPSLEDLVLHRMRTYDHVETLTIAVPSLQRLTLKDFSYGDGDGGYVINAHSLKYLNIYGFHRLEFCLIENEPELVEALITNVSDVANENFLESLISAKHLSLDFSPLKEIKYPTGKIFNQLLSLELHTNKEEWCNLLSLMLPSSPKLQILKLNDSRRKYLDKDKLADRKWNQPKCVPECLLFHLETFVWTRYEWQQEEEHEVATYILKNVRRLKKATLSTYPIESKELEKLEKRREMLNELASVVRASNSCHLLCDEADTYSF
ncbi:PREDICTED: FBD-associated F-box protein At3g49020-like [Camelina sativa]|uniref:FBD-associated F-box protein At3g49020-like n=1 Tax=Camelina sativa TaxID=90675 RepID=A0ABM1QFK6_CAMSA|nr:PREDICTED: FBD-associated F-box protein At3g49020-like [Camelina sativa]